MIRVFQTTKKKEEGKREVRGTEREKATRTTQKKTAQPRRRGTSAIFDTQRKENQKKQTNLDIADAGEVVDSDRRELRLREPRVDLGPVGRDGVKGRRVDELSGGERRVGPQVCLEGPPVGQERVRDALETVGDRLGLVEEQGLVVVVVFWGGVGFVVGVGEGRGRKSRARFLDIDSSDAIVTDNKIEQKKRPFPGRIPHSPLFLLRTVRLAGCAETACVCYWLFEGGNMAFGGNEFWQWRRACLSSLEREKEEPPISLYLQGWSRTRPKPRERGRRQRTPWC